MASQNPFVSGCPKKALALEAEEDSQPSGQVGTGGWFPRAYITNKVVTDLSSQCCGERELLCSRL
jgi:hypothetical protein